MCFSPDGKRLFVRQNNSVQARSYDPLTGTIGVVPAYSFPAASLSPYFGMERIAIHPDGSRLYVPVPGSLRIHDPQNGALLGTIPGVPTSPGGIAVERGLR